MAEVQSPYAVGMRQRTTQLSYGLVLVLVLSVASSCTSRGTTYSFAPVEARVVPMHPVAPRGLAMFDGRTGKALNWDDLTQAVRWAEVTFLGERHDDAIGHAVQLAIVEDVFADTRTASALSLEMLERNEQAIVNQFLAGEIDQTEFMTMTNSENWAGEGSWVRWYQPIIDAAIARDAIVVAANAPREYVRRAREGYASILIVPQEEARLFSLPRSKHEGTRYRERFFDLMSGGMGGGAHGGGMTPEMVEGIFRSQLLWDATMADSIDRTLDLGAKRVVHLIGGFHIEYEGGTVLELKARRPQTRILTVSLVPTDSRFLREEDHEMADVVIYTGSTTP